jgi:hypothetical protein
VLNISGALGAPLNVNVSATGSIFTDTSVVDFFFQTPPALINISALGTITYGFPVPPWPYGDINVITASDTNPFSIQGDVLLRFLTNGGSPPFGSVFLSAQHDINIGAYPAAVPLPTTSILFILGILVFGLLLYRQSRLASFTSADTV